MAAEASAGILLLAMAAVAMIWANLPGDSGQSYFDLWHTEINVSVGGHGEAHGAHDEHLGSHGDIPGGGVAAALGILVGLPDPQARPALVDQ